MRYSLNNTNVSLHSSKLIFIMLILSVFKPIKGLAQDDSHMVGVITGGFFTNNPELTWYNHAKNYFDAGIGAVYDYKCDIDEMYGFEIISSLMFATCSTAEQYNGDSKTKVTLPVEGRFYMGIEDFKVYLGAGLQYNFIWTINEGDPRYNNENSETTWSSSANQLSANGSVGFNILGKEHPVHFLLGTKFHFPIVNNGEGRQYKEFGTIDFTKDKTCISATAGVAVDLGSRSVLMLNYDYPLGSNKMTEYYGNFFEMKSQNITMSLMWRL